MIPLPRQTGRADFPHPAFARACCTQRSQVNQSQLLEVPIGGLPRGRFPRALATAAQALIEPLPYVAIEPLEDLPRLAKPIIIRPSLEVSIQLADELWERFPSLLARRHLPDSVHFAFHRFVAGLHAPVMAASICTHRGPGRSDSQGTLIALGSGVDSLSGSFRD